MCGSAKRKEEKSKKVVRREGVGVYIPPSNFRVVNVTWA